MKLELDYFFIGCSELKLNGKEVNSPESIIITDTCISLLLSNNPLSTHPKVKELQDNLDVIKNSIVETIEATLVTGVGTSYKFKVDYVKTPDWSKEYVKGHPMEVLDVMYSRGNLTYEFAGVQIVINEN